MSDRIQKELQDLRKEVHNQGIRLTLAQGWINLYIKGYDALLSYGVNFKSLKEYKDKYPTGAEKLPISEARNVFVRWFGKLESGIEAAIRRKQFRVHDNPDHE